MKRRAAITTFIVTLFCAAVLWAVTASDNFPYSDGNLTVVTANWSSYYSFNEPNVFSNRVRAAGTDTVFSAFYNAISPGADQFVQWTVATMDGSGSHAQYGFVRADATATSYFCLFRNGTTVEIYEETAGDGGVLFASATSSDWVANDIGRCEAVGTTITFKKNGSTVVSGPDGSITSGKPGIGLLTNSDGAGVSENEIDDWSGGDVTAAVAGMVARRRN